MKTNGNTLLIGVIYQGVEKYLTDYCKAIEFQDTNDFDILILNDKYRDNFPLDSGRIRIVNIEDKLTPAEIRMLGIKYALENNYKYVVFSDTDDYFSSKRISSSKKKLPKFDFVYNNLILINESGRIINESYSNYLKIKKEYNSYLDLVDRNLFGLSNTAVRVEKLKNLYIPKETIAVDWWIFTLLLLNGCKGGLVEEAKTYYRQSENNFMGFGKKLDEKRLRLGIKCKINHYKNVKIYCDKNSLGKEEKIYSNKLAEMEKLNREIRNPVFRKRYIKIINKNYDEIFSGWWSEILPIDEWRKYAE